MQKHTFRSISEKIASGTYRLVANHCLCGNAGERPDTVISEKDRYGFNMPTILCGKCGLIRSGKIFDQESNITFYKKDYRSLYVGADAPPDLFFNDQLKRGRRLLKTLSKRLPGSAPYSRVFEIGCGAGGILYPFAEKSEHCSGCDYDENYLSYGRGKGLDLKFGDYPDHVQDNSVHLLILSHVMEHFLRPVEEMQKIIRLISPGGHMLIEVPGIFYIHRTYFSPLLYLQNAHAYSFFRAYLNVFFKHLGMNVVYGNERCLFILQKPYTWRSDAVRSVFDESLASYPRHIKRYLFIADLTHRLRINPFEWANAIRVFAMRFNAPAQGSGTRA